ncbi:MAG: hypothetical protein H6981_05195 [Gammaproteobacteria bacterium]|nr:hypothetical protein [Gammaproteobacteria bacterium]MCP5136177.1 hypothetical protein [Gammaproteobacteria bacterium]
MSNHQTAKIAEQILIDLNQGFVIPTAKARKNLAMCFAATDKVIYGKAFDVVKRPEDLNLDDFSAVEKRLKEITLFEVKSTNRPSVPDDFSGYFFSLSTAELLVAQSLRDQYKFALVNTLTRKHVEMRLQELFAKAKRIYPTWSIRF